MTRISVVVCALTCLIISAAAIAQNYPTRPIRLIVPWPPGGTVDILARPVGQRLSANFGQPIVIDNRPGANSIVGSEIAAKSAPDGYTFLLDNVTGHSANISLYRKLPFNSLEDYAPIALIAATPNLIVVHPSTPVKTVEDMVAAAKAQPGKLAYASFGTGSAAHLAGEMLKGQTGIDLVHVPYKGGAPALADVVAGRVFLMFASLPSVIGHVRASRVRGIAIAGTKRSSVLPDVPTTVESGFAGLDATTWYGAMFPKRTQNQIVDRMNAEIVKVIREPEMAERLTSVGYELVGSTPAQLARHLEAETVRWGKVIKRAGIRLD